MKQILKKINLLLVAVLTFSLLSCTIGKIKVTFDFNDEVSKAKVVRINASETVERPNNPTRKHYEFLGWYYNNDLFDFETIIEENITLVAKWQQIDPSDIGIILNNEQLPQSKDNIIVLEKDEITFQYSKIQASVEGHVKLKHTGLLTNLAPIKDIKGIVVTFEKLTKDAKLVLYYGSNVLPIYNETEIENNVYITFEKEAHFIVIESFDKPFKLKDFYDKDHDDSFELKEEPNAVVDIEKIEIYLSEEGSEYNAPVLPKMYVDVAKDNEGNPLPILNKEDYVESKISLVDEVNEEYNLGIEEALDAGIRLRGNSTRTLPKKPYKIKFDKKQSLFGLPEAKAWALLADYMDGSALHNYSALRMGQNLESFNFTGAAIFIELYLNGKYQGLYLLNEHQEVGSGRVDIEQKLTEKLALEDMNFMIELDRSAIFYPDTEIEGIDYFKIVVDPNDEYGEYYFSIKYPKKKAFEKAFGKGQEADQRYDEFFLYVKNYTENLLDLFNKEKDFENFSNQVDVKTLTDFFLIDFITLETDHKYQSLKMHYIASEEKLYFGPLWDYDSKVMGLPYEEIGVDYPFDKANDSSPKPYLRKSVYNHFFEDFVKNYDGMNRAKQRYNEKGEDILINMINHLEQEAIPYITENLVNDANIWYEGNLSMIFENLKYTLEFLKLRQEFLSNKHFK